jgi:hypothetical protein
MENSRLNTVTGMAFPLDPDGVHPTTVPKREIAERERGFR